MYQAGKKQAGKSVWHGPVRVAAGFSLVLTMGCGQQYRPVVSAINPVGPAAQPTKYATAIGTPGNGVAGIVSVVDFSGDTVLATPSILSNPTTFALTSGGSTAYLSNSSGGFDNVPVGNPPTLITSSVGETTLASTANPVSIAAFTLTGSAGAIFVPEPGRGSVAALQNTTGVSLLQELAVGPNPTFVVGVDGTPRAYIITQGNSSTTAGAVYAMEGSPLSISTTIPVGNLPVYGVMTPDTRRAFILNKGSGTVNVINVVNNALDNTTPVIPASGTLGVNPVWADLSPRTSSVSGTNELVVLNAGDGTTVHPGTVSVISIPLCNAIAQPTNPNCNSANPVDATGFGTVLGTVTVGLNPTMVSVLQDGSRAYVVNQLDYDPLGIHGCGAGEGSVSVVNLQTLAVSATICGISTAAGTQDVNTTPNDVYGHPNTVATTTGSPTGKVYVTSSDNRFMTVIRTDTDTVDTHISLQGLGMPLPAAPPSGATVPVIPQSPGVLLSLP